MTPREEGTPRFSVKVSTVKVALESQKIDKKKSLEVKLMTKSRTMIRAKREESHLKEKVVQIRKSHVARAIFSD